MTTELEQLVDRARTADPDAWEALYRRAYPRLFAYARRRLATDEQAEDAVSEAMTRAMHGIGGFVWTRAGIDGWLFGIARNVVFETYREGARATPTEPSAFGAHRSAQSDDPLDGVVNDEDARRVRAAFARLTADERHLLELRLVVGLDAAQAGAVLGRRSGAVRTAQSRALQRLRREYAGSV